MSMPHYTQSPQSLAEFLAGRTPMSAQFKGALKEAVARFDTPFYAYDLEAIKCRVEALQKAFPAKLYYAMKANPRLVILKHLGALGVYLEAVSLGELRRAYQAGFTPEQVLLNGPVKTPQMLEQVKALGVPTLGLDSLPDALRVAQILPGAKVIIRINPDLPIATHDHLATGRGESKFGVLPQDLPQVLQAAKGLEILGLHVHLGSALNEPGDYQAGYAVMESLYQQYGPFKVLNLGGGFGLDLDPTGLAPLVASLAKQQEVWLEPGRYIVAEAGVLVSRTWGIKRTRRNFLLVDAGMSQLIRPMMYGAIHPVEALYEGGEPQVFDLAGPACESGDILAKDVTLPTPQEGDALAILQGGAYASSMSSNYLDTPRPAELLWTGTDWQIIRHQQSWEALLAEELGV
jgi:diaminopimelate decarboxylase